MTPWQTDLAYVFVFLFALAICVLISRERRAERFSEMSEREFEKEAEHSSLLSAGMLSLQKVVDADHKVEYVQQYDKHVAAEAAESGDPPQTPPK